MCTAVVLLVWRFIHTDLQLWSNWLFTANIPTRFNPEHVHVKILGFRYAQELGALGALL